LDLGAGEKGLEKFFLRALALLNSPVINNPAVRCEVGEPASAIDPKVAPPSVPAKFEIVTMTRLANKNQ
jgi:hypothetical protein